MAATLSLSAQAPQTQPPAQQPTSRPAPADDQQRQRGADTRAADNQSAQTVTVTGCLQEEKDVPGRRESIAERAGVNTDYILTNVKMAQSSSTSGLGLQSMYQIKGENSEVKKHLNHQVEVIGTLERTASTGTGQPGATGQTGAPGQTGASRTSASGSGSDNLPNLNATSIRMLAPTCAAQ